MSEKLRILGEELLAENWGTFKKTTLEMQRRDGSWQRVSRETYDSGNGAGILLYNKEQGTVVLVRQFRFPVFTRDDSGQMIEVAAGKLDGDDPAICAQREAEEETGYRVAPPTLVCTCYTSPGSATERLWLYVAEYDAAARVSAGGGLEDEGEDIEVLELPFGEAMAMLARGEIADAKTIILLQHLALNRLL
ncbi:NUDIX domain-containing protein [Devosia sp.]|uniref:NUDIX domain-containing protein n=1 Tax=Devosia sp. TaxID=1871048 RepID=UPI003A926FBB